MDDLTERVTPIVKFVSEIIEKKANSALKEYDVTIMQMRILWLLTFNGENSLKELENVFHTAQATIAGIVSRLEDKELVVAFSDEDDKRIKKIKLTDKGKDVISKAKTKIFDIENVVTANFTDDERNELIRLLGKVYENIK